MDRSLEWESERKVWRGERSGEKVSLFRGSESLSMTRVCVFLFSSPNGLYPNRIEVLIEGWKVFVLHSVFKCFKIGTFVCHITGEIKCIYKNVVSAKQGQPYLCVLAGSHLLRGTLCVYWNAISFAF